MSKIFFLLAIKKLKKGRSKEKSEKGKKVAGISDFFGVSCLVVKFERRRNSHTRHHLKKKKKEMLPVVMINETK
jgi:hypothetical protein